MMVSLRSRSICIIGQFGRIDSEFNGQSIKTLNFHRLVFEAGWFDRVEVVDTRRYRRNPIAVLWRTVVALLRCETVVLMVSMNGKSFYYPILSFAQRVFKNRIFQNIIGGSLPQALASRPRWVRYLNCFESNWAETRGMVAELQRQGVKNAIYVPNFRFDDAHDTPVTRKWTSPFPFCTFSRVTETKGIPEAIQAIANINRHAGAVVATLDIYGEIEPGFVAGFTDLLARNSDFVCYRGTVPNTAAIATLREHYCLLFPSRHSGEGFPGTLVDAMHAHRPVIASDWRFNAEIVEDGKTGAVYELGDDTAFERAISLMITDPALVGRMSESARARARLFSSVAVSELLSPLLTGINAARRRGQ